jgi:TolA-binding protein
VVLRIQGLPAEVVLKAGESWSPPPATATTKVSASAPSEPRRSAPHGATASPSPPPAPPEDDGSEAYAAAVGLFQGGRYAEAAVAFRSFALSHPAASQLEDASFLEAASLARAGRSDAAGLVAEDHLARFPRSFHRREAAILVARAARDRGDCAQARAVLAPWAESNEEARRTVGECAARSTGSP